jgi:hypothetical protein
MEPFLKFSDFFGHLCASVRKCALLCLPSFWASAQNQSGENQAKSSVNGQGGKWEYRRNSVVITFG